MGNVLGKSEVHVETTINAPVGTVWNIIKDVNKWQDWNNIMSGQLRSQNELREGDKFDLWVQTGEKQPKLHFVPVVDLYVKERGVQWTGHTIVKGIADGTHYLLLEKIDNNTTRLIHGERFSGLIIFLLKLIINFILLPRVRAAYVRFNTIVKKKAEAQV